MIFFFFKQKTAYEMRISDWSSDVCSSDLSSAKQPEAAESPTADQVRASPQALAPPAARPPPQAATLPRQRTPPQPAEYAAPARPRQRVCQRSEARRVGKECISTGCSRVSSDH